MDNAFWEHLWVAFALLLVVEGILPFLNPAFWRESMQKVMSLSDHNIRIGALITMLIGVALLYILKH